MIEQRSAEWFQSRVGCVTGSRIYEIIPGKRGAYRASREQYLYEKLTEKITGLPAEFYMTPAMVWGQEHEAEAFEFFNDIGGMQMKEAPSIKHPTIQNFSASPDGINEAAILEIKCPTSKTHIRTMAKKEIKIEWIYQMQAEMAVSGKESGWFLSYDPRLPEEYQAYVEHVRRDDEIIAEIEKEVKLFNEELDELYESISKVGF
jgi:putative phage-type endonuclease